MAGYVGHDDWEAVTPMDARAVDIYERHYSCRVSARPVNRRRSGICGPGEKLVLLGAGGRALLVWRRCLYPMSGQQGVNCAVFRNESNVRSSELLSSGEQLALARWPLERLFTFVDPTRIRSTNPGCCFKKAGWSRCGTTGRGLVILSKEVSDGNPR
jgi:hypothetical protein